MTRFVATEMSSKRTHKRDVKESMGSALQKGMKGEERKVGGRWSKRRV